MRYDLLPNRTPLPHAVGRNPYLVDWCFPKSGDAPTLVAIVLVWMRPRQRPIVSPFVHTLTAILIICTAPMSYVFHSVLLINII